MTLGELADKSGVGLNTISRIERGTQEPQAATLHKLAHALGKTAAELIREEEMERAWDPKADTPRSLLNYIERRGLDPNALPAEEFDKWAREAGEALEPNVRYRELLEEFSDMTHSIIEEARREAVEEYKADFESGRRIAEDEEAAKQVHRHFVSKVLGKLRAATNG